MDSFTSHKNIVILSSFFIFVSIAIFFRHSPASPLLNGYCCILFNSILDHFEILLIFFLAIAIFLGAFYHSIALVKPVFSLEVNLLFNFGVK